jgi:hypothetical protein
MLPKPQSDAKNSLSRLNFFFRFCFKLMVELYIEKRFIYRKRMSICFKWKIISKSFISKK